ncbi:hypothetical protein [uncultured Erythrobacter sp.]|uniref:hypothetical protein n=1 Tax=uncultured Erythrobacter sp. TaxID=263913 RepID=UPI00261F24D8|nr:hypothetical protein [uncultured Erythrobacter sp.]
MQTDFAQKQAWLPMALRILILMLAGLLVFYHLTMIYEFWAGQSLSADGTYNAVQAALRLLIAGSLTIVVLGKRAGLWMMWISIGGLVATQYWAHFGGVHADFTVGRHPLSYLKGFIIPSIITAAFLMRLRITS